MVLLLNKCAATAEDSFEIMEDDLYVVSDLESVNNIPSIGTNPEICNLDFIFGVLGTQGYQLDQYLSLRLLKPLLDNSMLVHWTSLKVIGPKRLGACQLLAPPLSGVTHSL